MFTITGLYAFQRTYSGTTKVFVIGALEQGEMHILRREGPRYVRLPFKFTGIGEGQYRVAGLAPGRYRFAYTKEGTPVLGEVEVGNESVEQDLGFPR